VVDQGTAGAGIHGQPAPAGQLVVGDPVVVTTTVPQASRRTAPVSRKVSG
jgi:hypothetical protein